MHGAPDSELPSGEYRIAPSEALREEYGIPLGDVLSGDFDFASEAASDEEFHKYTVERADGTTALDVLETHGSAEYSWLPFDVPQYVYLLVRPDGVPCLVVEVDHGWYPSYSIVDPRTAEPVGTVAKSRLVFGTWQLKTPEGAAVATAERTNTGRNMFSFSTHATYSVSEPGGGEFATFERGRSEGDFVEGFRSAMTVSCSPSSVSTELCLAFAFALLYQGTKSSGTSSHQSG